VVLLVVAEFDYVAHVNVLRHVATASREVKYAFGLSVCGEPVFAVNLLVVGGEGRLQVFVAFAHVLGDGHAVDKNDLVVLLVNPYFPLKVVFAFHESLGRDGEDIGVELIDVLTAKVVDVVLGLVFRGQDEWKTMFDFVKVGGGHHDTF